LRINKKQSEKKLPTAQTTFIVIWARVGGGGKRERGRSGGVDDAGDGGEQVELLLLL